MPFSEELPGPPVMGAAPALPPPPGQEPGRDELMPLPAEEPVSEIEKLYNMRADQEAAFGRESLANEQAHRERVLKEQEQFQKEQKVAEQTDRQVRAAWEEARNTKINDRALWDGMSGVQKAGAVIGGMMGGFLAVMNGSGRNMFMETFQQLVDQSMAAQRANLENKRAVAGALESTYERMTKRFGDRHAAALATEAVMYESGANDVLARTSLMKSDITRQDGTLQAQALRGVAQDKLDQARQRFFENNLKVLEFDEKQRHQMEQDRAARLKAAGAGKPKAPANALGVISDVNGDGKLNKLDLSEKQREQALFDAYGEPITDPETGALIVAGNAAQAASVSKGLAKARQARAALAEYDRLRHSYGRETGGGSGWTEGARKMRSARSLAMKSVKDAWDLGAITASDFELISGAVPEVPGASDVNVDHEALPRVIQDLDIGVDSQLNSMGYTGSYSQSVHGRVKQKDNAFADNPDETGSTVVDIRTPKQKAADAAEDAAKADKERARATREAGAAALDTIASPFDAASSGVVVVDKKGNVRRVPLNNDTKAKIKSGALKFASPDQHPDSGITVGEPKKGKGR